MDYNSNELMVCQAARQLQDGEVVFVGIGRYRENSGRDILNLPDTSTRGKNTHVISHGLDERK